MRRLSLYVTLVMLALAPAVPAQTARGRLLTDDTPQRPLPFATVSLHSPDGTERAVAVTDTFGLFVLRAPGPGQYVLRARRLGFQMVSSPVFTLSAGQTATYNFVVATKPATLREVRVIERRELDRRLRLYGIDPRASDARRITRERLEALDDGFHTISDAIRLQNIPGLTVQELGNGETCVYHHRGSPGSSVLSPSDEVVTSGPSFGGGCMRVLLDGTPFNSLASLSPGDLELVLIVSGSAATGIYGNGSEDGIVMLFTRGNAP